MQALPNACYLRCKSRSNGSRYEMKRFSITVVRGGFFRADASAVLRFYVEDWRGVRDKNCLRIELRPAPSSRDVSSIHKPIEATVTMPSRDLYEVIGRAKGRLLSEALPRYLAILMRNYPETQHSTLHISDVFRRQYLHTDGGGCEPYERTVERRIRAAVRARRSNDETSV